MAVKSAPQQEPGTGDCSVFVLMVTMYLMFGLRLKFNASHVEYFIKKIAVDILHEHTQADQAETLHRSKFSFTSQPNLP